jgi:hypothetical protein
MKILTAAMAMMMLGDRAFPSLTDDELSDIAGVPRFRHPAGWGRKKRERYDELIADGVASDIAEDCVENFRGDLGACLRSRA